MGYNVLKLNNGAKASLRKEQSLWAGLEAAIVARPTEPMLTVYIEKQ